jgi:hypothetical protein
VDDALQILFLSISVVKIALTFCCLQTELQLWVFSLLLSCCCCCCCYHYQLPDPETLNLHPSIYSFITWSASTCREHPKEKWHRCEELCSGLYYMCIFAITHRYKNSRAGPKSSARNKKGLASKGSEWRWVHKTGDNLLSHSFSDSFGYVNHPPLIYTNFLLIPIPDSL